MPHTQPQLRPALQLGETVTPDGGRLTLYRHPRSYTIRLNGRGLMDSSMVASERLLGDLAVESPTARANPRILIGGLGLGFTLQRVLATTGPETVVHMVELIPAVVDWNREYLRKLNGDCLRDPRVSVFIEDVWDVLARTSPGFYDAILLDIDNGPIPLVQPQNARLYGHGGITLIITALKRGGRVAIWSADREHKFAERLTGWGLRVKTVPAKTHTRARRASCTIYIADKSE